MFDTVLRNGIVPSMLSCGTGEGDGKGHMAKATDAVCGMTIDGGRRRIGVADGTATG